MKKADAIILKSMDFVNEYGLERCRKVAHELAKKKVADILAMKKEDVEAYFKMFGPARKLVNLDTSQEETTTIVKIITRAARLYLACGEKVDVLGLQMDLSACHLNGCPLDLARMLTADDFNLIHDVGGIHHHIDRTTGKLTGAFLPRFALPLTAAGKGLAMEDVK